MLPVNDLHNPSRKDCLSQMLEDYQIAEGKIRITKQQKCLLNVYIGKHQTYLLHALQCVEENSLGFNKLTKGFIQSTLLVTLVKQK